MKSFQSKTLSAAVVTLLLSGSALARDTVHHLPFAEVLDMPEAKQQLDGSVAFYLDGQKTPKVLKRLGTDISNRKTNGVGKSDEVGCRWAALSALLALQERAKQLGANAVVDISSYYKRETFKSPTEYECHGGAVVIGVTLQGTFAKVAR